MPLPVDVDANRAAMESLQKSHAKTVCVRPNASTNNASNKITVIPAKQHRIKSDVNEPSARRAAFTAMGQIEANKQWQWLNEV